MIVCPVCDTSPHIEKVGFVECKCTRLRAYDGWVGDDFLLWEFRYGPMIPYFGATSYIYQENDARTNDEEAVVRAVRIAVVNHVMGL